MSHVLARVTHGALLSATFLVVWALTPADARAAFGVAKWEAGTCAAISCTDAGPHSDFYTQAAGHPDFGITDFEFNYHEGGLLSAKEPDGHVRDVRVDLPVGLAVNPEAAPQCTEAQLEAFNCPAASQVGEDEAVGTAELVLGQKTTVTEHFPVYNMVRRAGEPARFGVEINSTTVKLLGLQGHLYLEGGISWHEEPETAESSGVASGDYHEFFKIKNIPTQPEVLESRLIFWGIPQQHTGVGAPMSFITLPSTCSSRPVTHLHVDSHEEPGHFLAYDNETPVTATGCDSLQLNPSLSLSPSLAQFDQPDGAAIDLHVPQATAQPAKPNSPDLRTTEVTLPEGMTLNPSAAHGLEACTNEQIGLGSDAPIGCPAGSVIGSIAVNAPGIPNGSLTGALYLGAPEPGQGAETGGKYRVFLAAEAPQFGLGLRLEGRIRANLQNGRLTAVFANTPQVPFEDIAVQLKGGQLAPLANPLSCGGAEPTASIVPYTGQPPTAAHTSGFTVDADGAGALCAAPLSFALAQSTSPPSPAQAGAYSPLTLNLARGDGQQYLSRVQTTLPAGLLGAIPSVSLCKEPAASEGACPAMSRVGTVSVAVGSGSEPYPFTGQVYLTGPYQGAPYGLSIVVPAVAGPYDLGRVVTRAQIQVGLYSGRVNVMGALPATVEGVPLRLRSLSIAIDRKDFLFNPTSCGPLATESLLTSTFATTQSLSSPFQVTGCEELAFKPSVKPSVGGRATKANGAGFEVKITQGARQANIRQVHVELPKLLPSRLTTLQKACPAQSFEAGMPPGQCASTAQVGTATVITPALPGKLSGPIYLVSHGGGAFPDLDLILRGDGIEVVLVGRTEISSTGVTSSHFETLPDVPISSVSVSLPAGPRSVLAANAPPCGAKLLAPTTIIAQSGAKITQRTKIAVTGCPLTIKGHRTSGRRALVTVLAPTPGRLTVSGRYLKRTTRRIAKAGMVTLKVPLSRAGVAAMRRHRGKNMKLKLKIGFVSSADGGTFTATPAVVFHR